MSLSKILLACAVSVAAVGAHAVPTYTVSGLSGAYGAAASFTATGNAGVATTTDANHQTPDGLPAGSTYMFAGVGGLLTINNVNSSTFSFVWGSPDFFNTVTFNTTLGNFAYTGLNLYNQFGIGSGSTVLNATLAGGTISSVSFASTAPAFEVAVAAVPEPETYALMAGGLMAIGFMVRRNKR